MMSCVVEGVVEEATWVLRALLVGGRKTVIVTKSASELAKAVEDCLLDPMDVPHAIVIVRQPEEESMD